MKKHLRTAISLILAAAMLSGCAERTDISDSDNDSSKYSSQQSSSDESADSTSPDPITEDPEIIEINKHIQENAYSVELSDEQKAVVNSLYDEYAKMALVFFYLGFDMGSTALAQFSGTDYECMTLPLNEYNTDGLSEETVKKLTLQAYVKYTGAKVNTLEKYKSERAKYFTEEFIARAEAISPNSDRVYVLTPFEENGAVYKGCLEGGDPSGFVGVGEPAVNCYVHKYEETDTDIEITVFNALNREYSPAYWTNIYHLKKTDGGFRIDSLTNAETGEEISSARLFGNCRAVF